MLNLDTNISSNSKPNSKAFYVNQGPIVLLFWEILFIEG